MRLGACVRPGGYRMDVKAYHRFIRLDSADGTRLEISQETQDAHFEEAPMNELRPCPIKLINANALKRKIERIYLPSNSLTAGVLYNLISTAPPIHPNRRTQPMATDEYQGRFEAICQHYGIGQSDRCFLQDAIYVLEDQDAQPANEPLTLDELRGMDGKPVTTAALSNGM